MVTPYPADELPLARAAHGEAVDNVEMFIGHGKGSAGVWIEASARPIREADGAFCGGVVVFRDVSERKRWERDMEEQVAREREKAEALERLRSAVMELSTPILEVWDDVLALPVIGVLDTKRSAEMMERLLQAVEEKQCRFVIIDITGVEVVDSATADRLLKLVTAVEIVGARCILTGARGAVAQTLVSLGADLGSLLTLRNLKHGLRECLLSMEEDGRRAPLKASRARGPRA
jgi:rsbT co-antagonist protein RsbR